MPSRSSHNPFGRRKQLIVYVGTAWATAFIRTSFPPIKRIFSLPESFLPTFSFNSAKTSFLDLPIIEGRPRYLECLESCIEPRISRTSLFVSWAVLRLKNIDDLSMSIFWPNVASYIVRISVSLWHSWLLALQNSKLSLTKKRWLTWGHLRLMEMPFSSLVRIA